MLYAYAANCKDTWKRQNSSFPRGNQLENRFPTTLAGGFYDPATTNAAYVAYNKDLKLIVVGFRPTDTLTLWKQNFKMWRTKPPIDDLGFMDGLESNAAGTERKLYILPEKASTHAGFNLDYAIFRRQMIPLVYNLSITLPSDYRIVFTGHSLGASLAEMAAVDFTLNAQYNASIINRIWSFPFASPRVGNRHWARFVNSLPFVHRGQSQRLVRYGDPTSQMPTTWFGYEQTFREIIMTDEGRLIPCPTNQADSQSGECTSSYQWFGNPSLHRAARYLEFLGINFTCAE